MRSLKRVAVLAVLALVGGAFAASASASQGTAAQDVITMGEFTCLTSFTQWPSVGGRPAPDCTGTFVGTLDGDDSCLEGCDFRATVQTHRETCINDLVVTESMLGDMYVSDGQGEDHIGSYAWAGHGAFSFTGPFLPPGTILGVATEVASIPLGTCNFPATNFTVTLAGTIIGS